MGMLGEAPSAHLSSKVDGEVAKWDGHVRQRVADRSWPKASLMVGKRGQVRRGRPRKFDGPSQVVAVTLPTEAIRALRKFHRDLACAIVTLLDTRPPASNGQPQPDAELVGIADGRYLIAVNSAVVRRLPGIHIVPLGGNRAFLALAPSQGMSDLALAVDERLSGGRVGVFERRALELLRDRLRAWRRDPSLLAQSRSWSSASDRRRAGKLLDDSAKTEKLS